MAKKKKKEEVTFELSKYQLDIIDFVENGQGNLVVEANAGAGKTSTLIQCVNRIPEYKRVLLAAFNKDIANELKKRTKGMYNVSVSTLHSLGLQMLQRNYPDYPLALDEFKYKSYVNANINSLSSINTYSLGKKKFATYRNNIEMLVNFGRCYICKTIEDLEFIEERYDIMSIADEKEVALKVMEYGMNNLEQVDFTDMIWLPNVLDCEPTGMLYDWIFLDEAQDVSVCQRNIVLKCRKPDTRMVSFGEKNQCLYAFSSADPESFDKLKEIPNTISLPLSVSYRCAKKIVEFAKQMVPSIEPNDDGREGTIRYDVQLDELQDGDMVLCRNNAPLMQAYIILINQGKKCFIRGKDIGLNLKNMVKRTNMEKLNRTLRDDGVFARLYDSLFDIIRETMCRYNVTYRDAIESSIIANKIDMIKALEILSYDVDTATELIGKIDNIFSDKKKDGISLSTIHKAKGLEANRVFIICKHLMPSTMAKKDWEIQQEHNLMYVAYTRARDVLGFTDDKVFDLFSKKPSETENILKEKESIVNLILKKNGRRVKIDNEYMANEVIRHATKIEKNTPTYKPLTGSMTGKSGIDFNNIFKRRYIKK